MPDIEPPRPVTPGDGAFRDFDGRLDALSASRQRGRDSIGAGDPEAGYRLVAELVGGVLVGLGLGWALDRLAHTAPFGLVGGLLIGTGLSVFLVVRTASRMSEAARAAKPAGDLADDGDDEDERA